MALTHRFELARLTQWLRRGVCPAWRVYSTIKSTGQADSRPPIAFLHIPKTAGTSVNKLIYCNLPKASVKRFYPPHIIPDRDRLDSTRLLIGHFYRGYEDSFFDQCERVTFLRHPYTRTVSQLLYDRRYYLNQADASTLVYKQWFEQHTELHQFPDFSRLLYYDNIMVRMISGLGYRSPYGKVGEQHLQIAKRNLEQFNFVGLTENYTQDIQALARQYGWLPLISHENAARSSEQLAPEADEIVARLNKFDLPLYEFAVKLHEKRRTAGNPDQALASSV